MGDVSGEQLPPSRSVQGKASWRRLTVRRTRIGGWWVALVAGTLVLLLLLIFVLQNGQSAEITFLGWHGALPLGVALLLAAIAGILAVAIPGTGRILQLRRAAHHTQRTQPLTPPSLAEPTPPPTQGDSQETTP